MTVAFEVLYAGTVQGVGFRAATASIARRYPVAGFVKNLPDGRVQLVVEGPANEVDALLKEVREYWRGNIEDEQVSEKTPTGRFHDFDIAR